MHQVVEQTRDEKIAMYMKSTKAELAEENSATLRLIHCQWGGWLAISPAGQSLQIGVVAGTREGAMAKFAQSAKAWADNLAKGAD